MAAPQKTLMVNELNKKLAVLREQKALLASRAAELAEKRDRLNGSVRNLRDEVQQLRNERDQINGRVNELKQQRNMFAAKSREKIAEIRDVGQQHRALIKERPRRSHQDLQKEVDAIDWEIQTTSHTLQEDKDLVGKVKQLEIQLSVHKKIDQLQEKMSDLRAEIADLHSKSAHCHHALTAEAKKSQETHAKMLQKLGDVKNTTAEADALHAQFVELQAKTKPIQEQIADTLNQIRQLKGEIRLEELKERKENEDQLRETLENRAREKLKRGEKLSWQEFQLLSEKGVSP